MARNSRFLDYCRPLVEALRSSREPMRPAEAIAWIRANVDIQPRYFIDTVDNGRKTVFENDVHWARFYLAADGLISKAKRGRWALTERGREIELTDRFIDELYGRVAAAKRSRDISGANDGGAEVDDNTDALAPYVDEVVEADETFWLVGSVWTGGDQIGRFLDQGIWENGYDDRYLDKVRRMRPGERIAVKSAFVQKHNLPFDIGDKSVSAMRIKATGVVTQNSGDGRMVKVAWDPPADPRDWYFYTFRLTIVGLSVEDDHASRLYDFIFNHQPQDFRWWLQLPYFVDKYGPFRESNPALPAPRAAAPAASEVEEDAREGDGASDAYELSDIVAEGCFLSVPTLMEIVERWRAKKNLILQGPPGTGKTWLAKRLGLAIIGSDDRETTRTRLRVVQFHPSLSYEDFVRGYRPVAGADGEGKLVLQDGIMMEAIEAARAEPDLPFVLVIEEVNRGNPAQIFGEMLTLLESTKRRAAEAMELTYRRGSGERVYVPDNLYVIGTMNVADRSLALVDLALRRRFAFVDLEPAFNDVWREWCVGKGLDVDFVAKIESRITRLNEEINSAPTLGSQFRIGHSFLTPDEDVADGGRWYRARVETEIGPLLDEYWYDAPDTAKVACDKLLAGLG